ncbi:putative atp-dependent helicase ypra [Quercus suber]|uniref:Atp-dependent helicase ypra n=1 Tax=Quercus suber TaxID=58331 RepID=A0AAW0MED3_QUESU
MKEAESNREIQVRTITGESTTVSISSHSTIEELKKLLLNQSFLPASNSPNFHLFFKASLSLSLSLSFYLLQSLISTHCIEPGDFLVLVPFTRKEPSQTRKSEQSKTSLNNGLNNDSISKFADLAWSDMMQDLSYLRETSNDETATNDKVGRFSLGDRTETMAASFSTGDRKDTMDEISNFRSFGEKRGRGFDFDKGIGLPYDLILSSLQFSGEGVLDEHNCDVFVKVLESVNCLSDPRFGFCLLSRKAKFWAGDMGVGANNSSSCLCPAWLKIIMKAFAFLNIFSAFLHFQQKGMTTAYLEEALNQLAKSGIKLGMKDIEHLSVLSPKGVRFSDNEMEKSSFGDTLVIINCSTERKDQVDNPKTACKRIYVPKIVSALKKRESSFKTNLSEAVQCKKKTEMAEAFSLEDLILSVKDCSTAETSSLLPVEMVEHLRKGIGSTGQMVHVEDIGARKATYMEIPNQLSENLRSALKSMGIAKLYSHQAESIQASLAGKNVVVATMTSSGKSLCYNLPVLEVLSQNLLSCALYLFPTKALAQDQLRALLDMTKGIDASLNIGIYDGDTSQKERTWLRDNARLLITNPDMLHISILPHHERFRRILSNLRFVIIDEAHSYKGAFGCHTALIIRRLRRLCSHVYGSDPSFVFCTATSANPLEHCMELANLPTLELIQSDGSPSARKLFILWNPVVSPKIILKETQSSMDTGGSTNVNSNLRHSSPLFTVSCLFAEMVQHGLRCIAFCKSRKLCEIVLSYTREILQDTGPHLVDSICVYRAGYIAEDRRRIERDFFDGKLCGIAATNALELGIDVGHIDVTLHLGFPGSIASLWQQAGRAGRREKPSLAVYVAFGGPLDQYFMNHPKKLFGSPIECCHIDSQNQQVLEQHLVCAAHEHSLCLLYDEKYFGSGLSSAINSLKTTGYLSCDQSCDSSTKIWNYIGHEVRYRHIICNTSDLAPECPNPHDSRYYPERILLYDQHPGGIGVSVQVQPLFTELLTAALELLTSCYCFGDSGCPNCVQSFACHEYNEVLHKDAAIMIIKKFPSHSVSIRAIENERYEVIDQRSDELLEEIEESKAFFQVYEGAVYMRQGKTYLVKKLDLSSKTAVCEEADLKYYTRTRDYTDVHVNGGNIAYPVKVAKIQLPRTTAKANTCKVTTNWFGFYRIWRGSNQIFDTVELSLPSYSYNSQYKYYFAPTSKQAVWIPVPQLIKAAVNKRNFDFRGGLHAASHALLNVVPLFTNTQFI